MNNTIETTILTTDMMKVSSVLAPIEHKVIVLLGLGNPEPLYAKTRHNVAPLVLNAMSEQLASVLKSKVDTHHGLITRTRSEPGKKHWKRHMSKFFDLEETEGEAIEHKKYLLDLNYQSIKGHGVKMVLLTPSINYNPAFDKSQLAQYDYDFKNNFNRSRITYCLGYVDNTFMNSNGKVVADFLSNQKDFFKQKLKGVNYYDGSPNPEILKISNYILADDIETPIGEIKIRNKDTSARGHNGFRSCAKHMQKLEDLDYVKVSLGISLKKWDDNVFSKTVLRDFVLGKFSDKEVEYIYDYTIPKLWSELKKIEVVLPAK